MAVLNFKPHKLQYLCKDEGYEDENGDWHAGREEWVEVSQCDVVPAGQATQITLPDGTTAQYTYTIYLPASSREFHVGERVRILFNGYGTRLEAQEFSIKGYHRYQLQSKMWV